MKRNYYDILQVPIDASLENIKSKRNQLALKYHPDRTASTKGTSALIFNEVMVAYSVLSNPQKSSIYNALISKKPQQTFSEAVLNKVNSSNLFSAHEIKNIKAGLVARELTEHRKEAKIVLDRQDFNIRADCSCSLEDVYFSHKKEVSFERFQLCSSCSGSGAKDENCFYECPNCLSLGFEVFGKNAGDRCASCAGNGIIIRETCVSCHGKGHKKEKASVSFIVPKGAVEKNIVSLRSEGDRLGNVAGTLFVHLTLLKHPLFDRNGKDLKIYLYVPPLLLVNGGIINVPSFKGPLPLKIKPGAGQHTTTIKHAGMPYFRPNHWASGDLTVVVIADFSPRASLIKKQQALIADFFAKAPSPVKRKMFSFFFSVVKKLRFQ